MIKIATVNDIESLVQLRIKLLKESNSNINTFNLNNYCEILEKYYRENLLNHKVIAFLALENNIAVAISIMCFYTICPSPFNLDGKMALLTDMYTIPEYRNKGLGTTLLKTIMEYTKNLGYRKVTLNATDSGRKLYEKYGFKNLKGEMFYKFTI